MRDGISEHHDRLTSRRELIRLGLGAAAVAALPAPLVTLRALRREPDTRYLDAALGAARWLRETAVTSADGTIWPAVPPDAKTLERNLYTGFPGVMLFLAELHRATGDRAWLDLATSGADALAAMIPDAEREDGAGLYSGLAGIAFTLETVGHARGDTRYDAAVRKALGTIVASAHDAGAGIEWTDTTDIISGTAGTGLYLLRASVTMRDDAAREVAIRAGRRLVEREYRTGDTSLWMMSPGFTRNMPNFSHGTAGVAYFLATLAAQTRDPGLIAAAERGGRYLQSIATPTAGDGRRVFHDDPDGRDLFYLSWCHGPAGTARLFHRLGAVTGDRKWSGYVPQLAQGIVGSGVPDRSPGFWNNISQCCGNCGVSDFFVSLAALTKDARYLEFARRVADDTLARATADGDGLKWIQAENRVSPNDLAAQTGLMQGAAGVGLALLRLDGAIRGRRPFISLPDDPFTA